VGVIDPDERDVEIQSDFFGIDHSKYSVPVLLIINSSSVVVEPKLNEVGDN
jgi:hypothetical protein